MDTFIFFACGTVGAIASLIASMTGGISAEEARNAKADRAAILYREACLWLILGAAALTFAMVCAYGAGGGLPWT